MNLGNIGEQANAHAERVYIDAREAELDAMRQVDDAIRRLGPEAAGRVLRWALSTLDPA